MAVTGWVGVSSVDARTDPSADRPAEETFAAVATSAPVTFSESAAAGTVAPTTDSPHLLPPAVTVTGPVSGGAGQHLAAVQDLAAVGYVEEEYFFTGEASSYRLTSERTHDPDGVWEAGPDETAPYTTRMIVRRPSDPDDFSGTVVVEWLNVSAGRDLEADWTYTVDELIREGHAWVGVSAQAVGVHGGVATGAELEGGLAGSDPERYGTLSHPGDTFSFDIFTQAGVALLNPDGPAPLGDLTPTHLVASGISLSAAFVTAYVNAVQPLADLYDGFFIHARGSAASQVNGYAVADPVLVRTDLRAPVFIFETETDVPSNGFGYYTARQDDTATIRTWEVAGTAHTDQYAIDLLGWSEDPELSDLVDCDGPAFNDGPHHEVAQAAMHHLVAWVNGGPPPPEAPRLALIEEPRTEIERDEHGNAIGGVRTPLVDVPIATLTGDPTTFGPGIACTNFGATIPFDAATLAALHPTQADYISAFTDAADAAVVAGFLLRPDADAMIAEAELVTLD